MTKLTRAAYLTACSEIITQRCEDSGVYHPGDIAYAADTVYEIGAAFMARLNIKLDDA